MGKKYTTEKILYLADQDKPLHVSPKEEQIQSDLHDGVARLLARNCLEKAGEDDAGKYYRTTRSGKIELLKLQINWRKQHGKDCEKHQLELDSLVAA